MARNLYGGSASDFTINDIGHILPNVGLTVWTAQTGGTQVTDLLDANSVACSTLNSGDAGGPVQFYGPDGVRATLWLQSDRGVRLLVRPVDATSIVAPGSIIDYDVNAAAAIDRSKIDGISLTQASTGVFSVLDYGADPTGVADSTVAIQDALDWASTAKATVIVPPGTYRTTQPLYVHSDTTLVGTGTIDAVVGNLPNGTLGSQTPVFYIQGASDVHIEGITIVGNKAEWAEATEYKHGLSIFTSNRVTIRNVTTIDNKGDGVCLGAGPSIGSGHGDPCFDIVLDNVIAEHNHRQGLSICSAVNVQVRGGSYSYTDGSAPQAGIDIEPDLELEHRIDNIDIIGIQAKGNTGAGIMVVTGLALDAKGVRITGGLYEENSVGVWLHNVQGCTVDGVTALRNVGSGIYADSTILDSVRITGNLVKDNHQDGIRINMPGAAVTGLLIADNRVIDNCTDQAIRFSGIDVQTAGTVVTARNVVRQPGIGFAMKMGPDLTSETHIDNQVIEAPDGLLNRFTANQASADTDTTGWYTSGVAVLSVSDAVTPVYGTKCLAATASGAGINGASIGTGATTSAPVSPGETITFTVALRCSTNRSTTMTMYWRKPDGTALSNEVMGTITALNSAWSTFTWTGVVPAGAAYAIPDMNGTAAGGGEVLYFDCAGLWGGEGGTWVMPGSAIPRVNRVHRGNRLSANQATALTDTSGVEAAGSATITRVTTDPFHGNTCFQSVSAATTGAAYGLSIGSTPYVNSAPVTPGEQITFYIRLRTSEVDKPVVMRMYWRKADGTGLSMSELGTHTFSTSWTEFQWQGIVPAGAFYALPSFYANAVADVSETMWVDTVGVWGGNGGCWSMPGTKTPSIGTIFGATDAYNDYPPGTFVTPWTPDANPYRTVIESGVASLSGSFAHAGDYAGFFGAPPVSQPTVAGARDETEGAMVSLLAALVRLGLITDSTTAS